MRSNNDSQGSVTRWIEDLRNENPDARAHLWKRFVSRLIAVANRILKNSTCRIATGETIAVDAFVDFFERSPDEFRRLVNRNDLWKILSVIAERRAIDEIRRESREKRGGKQNVMNEDSRGMSIFPSSSTPPDVELILIETFEARLKELEDPMLRHIALEKMNECKNEDIAQHLKISIRSVERKLSLIRKKWNQPPQTPPPKNRPN